MREFGLILLAGVGCAALGAGFGWLLGSYAPEFIQMLAGPRELKAPERVALALGAVNGLLIGAGAMGAGLLVAAIRGRAKA
ncbi:MAG: hypothetical protein KDA44_05320 [Planctomycetales bacterium]|nr:hypothetical protein [Planctomycetales bacterium]